MLYDFVCDKCGHAEVFSFSMREVSDVKPECQCKNIMRRHYTVDNAPKGFVYNTIGSMMDRDKSRAMPKEWFWEQSRKKPNE